MSRVQRTFLAFNYCCCCCCCHTSIAPDADVSRVNPPLMSTGHIGLTCVFCLQRLVIKLITARCSLQDQNSGYKSRPIIACLYVRKQNARSDFFLLFNFICLPVTVATCWRIKLIIVALQAAELRCLYLFALTTRSRRGSALGQGGATAPPPQT